MKVSKVSKSIRLGVTVRSPEPYHDAVVESVEEFLETVSPETGRRTRGKPTPQQSTKSYTPSEVVAVLNVSYDTAIGRWEKMGCVDMGTKEHRYKRGKRTPIVSAHECPVQLPV